MLLDLHFARISQLQGQNCPEEQKHKCFPLGKSPMEIRYWVLDIQCLSGQDKNIEYPLRNTEFPMLLDLHFARISQVLQPKHPNT